MNFLQAFPDPRTLILMWVPLLLIQAGCSLILPEQPTYVTSAELQPLEVPDGLSSPETRRVFEIPGYSLPELSAQGTEELPPSVPTSAEAEQARSRIRFGSTGLYLEVDDEAASVWRRVGFALNRGGMSIDQVLLDERRFQIDFRHDPIVVSERGWFGK
ncbi:MAG: hypothetical protein LC637_02670, partial [Xanthomonadaceae bacterium]|nr:hypothetical protein [Xanthomonadaceae bacterium]